MFASSTGLNFFMTYYEQLKRPEWQRKRLEILQRDNFTCQECDSTINQLHVHHTTYRKGIKAWEYDNSELITLCHLCHESITLAKKEVSSIIDSCFNIPSRLWGIHAIISDISHLSYDELHDVSIEVERLCIEKYNRK